MSPALTTITRTMDDEARQTCSSCMGELSDMALKCNKCQRYVHLRCSGMPEYQLARLAVSQVHFVCASCVKSKDFDDEDHYNAEITKTREIIAKEISIIDQLNKDADSSISLSPNEKEADKTQADKTPNCRYFLQGNCKHGRAGKNCSYNHPKLCFNFIKRGDQRGGCKKGQDCAFVHPNMCQSSLQRRKCFKKGCHRYHVRGTQFSSADADHVQPQAQHSVQAAIPQNVNKSYSDIVRKSPYSLRKPDDPKLYPESPPSQNHDFLELKLQMKVMQDQILQLMLALTKGQMLHPPPNHQGVGWPPRQ